MHIFHSTGRVGRAAAIAAAVLIAGSPALLAQQSGASPNKKAQSSSREKNAALEYMSAFEHLNKEMSSLAGEEYAKLSDPDWAPSERLALMLEDNQRLIKRLIEASKLPTYDMQLRYEEGFSLLVSHASHLRQFTRILAVDARRLALLGRSEEAVERLLTIIRMGRHLSEDRVLICSLVAIAITNVANRQIEVLAAEGALSDASRREYIRHARQLLTDDPFGSKKCIGMERTLAVNTIRPIIEGKGEAAGKELARQLRALQVSIDNAGQIAPMNEEQIEEQIDLMDRYYAALIAAWGQKDALARLGELEKRLEQGDYGLLMKEIGPALSKAHMSVEKAVKELKDVIALLEASGLPPTPEPEVEVHEDEAPMGE